VSAIEHDRPLSGKGEMSVRLRPLGGHSIAIRRDTRDAQVLWDTFGGRYHLPPPGPAPRVVLDLGAYTGMTTAHMAARWPGATVVGVELDAGNAAVARENVAAFGSRCRIVHAGIWPESGEVAYERPAGEEDAHRVTTDGELHAAAVTVGELVDAHGLASLDFVKIDIEGAEARLLRENADWLMLVGSVKVEVHPPYSIEGCIADLQAAGMRAWRDGRHWSAVAGTRERGYLNP
jgi:FkbM family methyltransferase